MERSSEEIPAERIASNLARVRNRMAEAALRSGRNPESVKLIAVTKYVGIREICALSALGVTVFGESRVQDVEKKIQAMNAPGSPLRRGANGEEPEFTFPVGCGFWHLIGHLQTNKADKAVSIFRMVHSVDSLRVAQTLNKERDKARLSPLACLIEVNVAGEANKFGFPPQISEINELLKQCAEMSAISIAGLMCMAPHSEMPEPTSRPVFGKLRELMAEANSSGVYPSPLTELSMGMTQDYDIAIEEGATMVRVGSALFE